MDKQQWLGKRVVIDDGVLSGELATVVVDDRGVWWEMDGEDETVFIRFDRQNAHLGVDKGYAILSDRWEYIDNLKVSE